VKNVSPPTHDLHHPTAGRVLLVDADALPRRAVTRWLGGLGLEVVGVSTAEEALALLAAERFDVVIADWLYGSGERGDTLLAMVRDRYPDVRRVLFSDQPVEDASCAHFYIAKPASVGALERAIRSSALHGPGALYVDVEESN
jgi:DNA-binding NarL/FixJ family response regulator